jgi:hypothetical protein
MVLIMKTRMIAFVAVVLSATAVAAQDVAPSCSNAGPGARFGVTSYTCVSCRIDQKGGKTTYGFETEPVILQLAGSSSLQPGDVVVAINGKPITTEAGASQFTNPPAGNSTLKIRRGRSEFEVQVQPSRCVGRFGSGMQLLLDGNLTIDMDRKSDSAVRFQLKGGGLEWRLNKSVLSPRLRLRQDSITNKLSFEFVHSTGEVSSLGLGIECLPSCTLGRNTEGKYYYRFDGYPRIGQIKTDAAPLSVFRVGDRIISIDRVSILTEEGVEKLHTLKDGVNHTVVVERDGRNVTLSLQFR